MSLRDKRLQSSWKTLSPNFGDSPDFSVGHRVLTARRLADGEWSDAPWDFESDQPVRPETLNAGMHIWHGGRTCNYQQTFGNNPAEGRVIGTGVFRESLYELANGSGWRLIYAWDDYRFFRDLELESVRDFCDDAELEYPRAMLDDMRRKLESVRDSALEGGDHTVEPSKRTRGPQKKSFNVNSRVMSLYFATPESREWTSRAVADAVGATAAAVRKTDAWKMCQEVRRQEREKRRRGDL